MSATVKIFTSAFALSLAVGAANAQQMNSGFFSGMTSAETKAPETEQAIDAQKEKILRTIEEMLQDVSSSEPIKFNPGAVTIEEIDQRNREAKRLEHEYEIREKQYKQMTAQIEMLLVLEKARESLLQEEAKDTDEAHEEEEEILQQQAAIEADLEKRKFEQEQAKLAKEQMNIPRLQGVIGSAGNNTAMLVSVTGVYQEAQVGDILADGFRVVEITNRGVGIEAMETGNKYFVLPSASTPRPPADSSSEGSLDAVDLSSPNLPGMF